MGKRARTEMEITHLLVTGWDEDVVVRVHVCEVGRRESGEGYESREVRD